MDAIICPPPDEAGRRAALISVIQGWATEPFKADGMIGVPYLWDGKDPDVGLDCSGCVTAALEAIGLVIPSFGLAHNALSLYALFDPVDPTAPQPADFAFYGSDGVVDHVMTVLSATQVIGASGGGSSCTSLEIARKLGACVHVRTPIKYRSDLIGFRSFDWA